MLLEFQIYLFVACLILTYITQYSETPPYGHLVITANYSSKWYNRWLSIQLIGLTEFFSLNDLSSTMYWLSSYLKTEKHSNHNPLPWLEVSDLFKSSKAAMLED